MNTQASDQQRSTGLKILVFFIGTAAAASLVALGLDVHEILNFKEENPLGGTLIWSLGSRIPTAAILAMLLVFILSVKRGPTRPPKRQLIILVCLSLVVMILTFTFDGSIRSVAKEHIQQSGLTMCEQVRKGKGKYARDHYVFKLNCQAD